MDWLTNLIWHDGKLLGIEWSFWKAIGWLGNIVFFTRFLVQWYATEKKKRVVVEHNGEAVAPSEFSQRRLNAGDRLEIVKIVAGG